MQILKTSISSAIVLAFALSANSSFANKQEKFTEMDTNKDGKVTAMEHETSVTSKFTAADANGDGTLTKGELSGFMMEEKGKSPGKANRKSDKKIAMFDMNEDGSLTRQEFTTGSKTKFTEMDANGDGSLTMEEMEAGHKK